MKIAIPVDDKNIKGNVCLSFGRAPYFMLHDTENKENSYIINSAANSQGGAGIKAAQIILDYKADVLITPRCGENAAHVLKAAQIKIYKSDNNSIEDNLKKFKENKLKPLDQIHHGFHGHGGK
ncbi:MAG: NifB/NifX family molybdenum-iron cluster-binding protein [Sedimentibacter sp.]|jgi:predicted Fe-Mo cluster-binding NifX family protein